MTTEREYQEGQDRIRRAQGRREYLRRNQSSFNLQRSFQPTNSFYQYIPWVFGAIVFLAIAAKLAPVLLERSEAPANRVEQRR
ncbi:hypothetical protein [Synechococcus sp. PCC 7336]|uniref:hypothetical protein n=1 Tax=Synechococcus sp. PCC 7336 TaxID=195250 RepID=UPI0003483273|nr:hypothetical protein [Synechococcus sp. PCC 7336]